MDTLKIAQLACFQGNIGDLANVSGTRKLLSQNTKQKMQFSNIEYLDYDLDTRWRKKQYDENFVNYVNKHDLLIIGGGGFFELACDHTSNGTPLDLPIAILDQIKIPIVFYALGFDTVYGISETKKAKFKKYLEYILSNDKILVSLRNDGSKKRLNELFGDLNVIEKIVTIPDGGFFLETKDFNHPELPQKKFKIAINLTGDMSSIRFNGQENYFLQELTDIIVSLLKKYDDIHFVLIPHIPEDLTIITKLLTHVGPPYNRLRVSVAAYSPNPPSAQYSFDIYKKCNLSIGMRFHANVCSIAQKIPTIGVATHQKIIGLYEEMNMSDRCVLLNKDFSKKLTNLILETRDDSTLIKEQYASLVQKLNHQLTTFHKKIHRMIEKRGSSDELNEYFKKQKTKYKPKQTTKIIPL